MVVDASALLEVILRRPEAGAVRRHLGATRGGLHGPHLIDIEAAQVVRRYAANGIIDRHRGETAMADLADFPLVRHPHAFLLSRVWELRANLTASDAVYVALAEALNVPLLTRDRRLAAAAGVRARVQVV